MGRYGQTIARIGFGLAAMASLVWLLWDGVAPNSWEPEALFTFVTAFAVWVFSEFKRSEEYTSWEASEIDLRLGKRLVELHQGDFRFLLHEMNLWSFIEVDVYQQMWSLIADWRQGRTFFSHGKLQSKYLAFMESLGALSAKITQDTTQEQVGGQWVIGYKPYERVTQQRYDELMEESRKADAIADTSWRLLEELIGEIRKSLPNAYDKAG